MHDTVFNIILRVFVSYRDEGQMIMKGYAVTLLLHSEWPKHYGLGRSEWLVGWLVVLGLTAL